MKVKVKEIHLKGAPISRGIAIGKPFFFTLIEDEIAEFTIARADIKDEISRYNTAVERSKEDIRRLQKKLKKEKIHEGVAILDTHLQMMQDPLMTTNIEEEIRHTRKNAEFVFQSFIKQYQKKFQSLADPYFRERFKDIQDIYRRILGYLRESVRVSLADLPPSSIVFSQDLTASDTAEANVSRVSAFVTETGGGTSHAAIVAKAKGIPFVSQVEFDQVGTFTEIDNVIVDGRTGDVIINPSQEILEKYIFLQKDLEEHLKKLSEGKDLAPETYDGYRVKLSANIDMVDELDVFHKHGGHGVGLFRSEYIFVSNDAFPSEDEQFAIYKRIVKKMKGLPIVIRTFDFGGDKMILNQQMPFKGNPFLGCRAIRYLLKERDIFKAQLCAILRASAFGKVNIMFPMISALSELLEAKSILEEAKETLKNRGEEISKKINVGCMIEVPSAAVIADLLAKECDFLSIGTNDLVQYSLAVDRGNHSYNGLYSATDPSVIRMIKLVVSEANLQGIPVTLCGEVASDPRFTPLLLGLGVHELSVSSRFIPVIKNAIRNISIVTASQIAEKALSLTNAEEILDLLTQEYQKSVPADRFYNC